MKKLQTVCVCLLMRVILKLIGNILIDDCGLRIAE